MSFNEKKPKLIDYLYRTVGEYDTREIRVYFGTDLRNMKSVRADYGKRHPLYLRNDSNFDAALIRLSNPVKFVNNGKYYERNMICLPPKNPNWTNAYEYVFLTGWGRGHNNHLQTGAKLLVKDLYNQSTNIRYFLQTIDNETISCYVSAIF